MLQSTRELLTRAETVAKRLRAAGQSERANRFCGRAEVVIARHCARHGEPLPTLYVREGAGYHADLVTWAGNRVGHVEIRGTARGFHGVKLYCYRAVIEGRAYHGRGQGPGMYLNMRPGKRVA